MESRINKIRQIRKMAGVQKYLSWSKLCELTDFDSFATALCFWMKWKESCPNDRLVTMPDNYINMILFNLKAFPKQGQQNDNT